METKLLQLKLSSLTQQAVDLQHRLLSWSVTTADDRDAVRDDVYKLKGYMDDVCETVGIDPRR